MDRFVKLKQGLLILILVMGFIGPASIPIQAFDARIHPEILQIADDNPEQWIAVIIQKAGNSNQAEKVVQQLGGEVTKDLHIINAFAAELPAGKVTELIQLASVSWVSLDAPIKRAGKPAPQPDPSTDPTNTYLDTLGVRRVWNMGYTGSGIGVAIIDSGISPDKDFTRIQLSRSFNPYATSVVDGNGHGTHVAGIIAGNGYDSAGFYKGIAPGASLFSLKISDDTGMAYESDVVAAMQWVLDNKTANNIRVVNLSIQSTTMVSYHQSPIDAAAEILWFNGVVVVAASGNWDGTSYNPILAAPANDPFIITVGATTEKGTPDRRDDAIASFSAQDETQEFILKPELYAPGTNIVSVLSGNSDWDLMYPERVVMNGQYFRLSGTSMSTPMVTGAIALLLQAEPNLTPDQVKYRLINTAGKVSKSPGYLDIYAALTTPTTASANTGLAASQLLWTGTQPITWDSVSWNSVSWNSVSWNSVSWNSVSWNSVSWNATYWGEE